MNEFTDNKIQRRSKVKLQFLHVDVLININHSDLTHMYKKSLHNSANIKHHVINLSYTYLYLINVSDTEIALVNFFEAEKCAKDVLQ